MKAYKEKAGTWYIQYRYKTLEGEVKKSCKRGFRTKREAEEWYRNFLLEQGRSCTMLFSSLVSLYMKDMGPRLREHTMINKEYIIRDKILPVFGSKQLNQITAADVREWQTRLMSKKYSQTYLRTINNNLSTLFNYAVRYYGLAENPCRRAGCMGKNRADEMKIWTRAEFEQFHDCLMDKRISWLAFEILFWTGIRIGELMALTFTDVDLEKKIITINKSYQRLHGKDVITPPKTPKSNRKVNIPQFLADDIRDYEESLYDFDLKDRIICVTKNFLERELVRGVKLSGVKKIRIHDLRHSHASLLIEMGFSPKEIAERLGHENIETTLNTYAHLYPNKQEQLASRLDDFYAEEVCS